MNERGGKRSKPGDRKSKYGDPALDAAVAEVVKAIEVRLAGFEQHKKELLEELCKAYQRDPNSEPFDTDKAWRRLTSVASYYFHRDWLKQNVTSAAERRTKLFDVAKALRRARDVVSEVMQSDAANDLASAWWDADPAPMRLLFGDDKGLLKIVDLQIFDKAVGLLDALEATALRAADDVPARRGRPKGTANLPWDFIATLAFIYRESTCLRPGAGEGPFAQFVWKFAAALGRRYEFESVVDDIKHARLRMQRNKWSSSPFDAAVHDPLGFSFGD